MSSFPEHAVRELSAEELRILSTMLRQTLYRIDVDTLHLDIETGNIESGMMIMNPTPSLSSIIAITLDFHEAVDQTSYHLLKVSNEVPTEYQVRSSGENWWIEGPGGSVQVSRGAGRRVVSIDVISYRHEIRLEDQQHGKTLTYDRALIFEFDQGEPLTLTTDRQSILSAIQIKVGRKPGRDHDEGIFATRVTLH